MHVGKRVADNLPKGPALRHAKVRTFQADGSVSETLFEQIQVSFPTPKQAVTMRFDQEVIDYFKSLGAGYQTKMNAVLKAFVEHEKQKA